MIYYQPASKPPRRIISLVSALLPPSKREQVLGDLEERFHSSVPEGSDWTYLADALKSVPPLVWRSLLKRNAFGLRPNLTVAGAPARHTSYEARVRELEDTIWRSNTISLWLGPLAFAGSLAFHTATFVDASVRTFAWTLVASALQSRHTPPVFPSLFRADVTQKERYRFEIQKRHSQLWSLPAVFAGTLTPLPYNHPAPILSATYTSFTVVSLVCLWITASRYYSLRFLKNQIAELDGAVPETSKSEGGA